MLNNKTVKALFSLVLALVVCISFSGCVDQHPEKSSSTTAADKPRLIATSPAVVDICDKLDLDLVGVCDTKHELPERYKDLPRVGAAMNPDIETIKSLNPDYVLSPATLQSDLEPKYKKAGCQYVFLNLKSVEGMYDSIVELGNKFNRSDKANELKSDFNSFMDDYKSQVSGKEHPKVLILMGLPGSYLVATPKSYVGNLVELAGGTNVFSDSDEEFLNVNTEELKMCEPDIILRAAHGIPDEVTKMFADEFENNQIWKHFKAVKEGHVYDLESDYYNMSATLEYKEALKRLQPKLYQD